METTYHDANDWGRGRLIVWIVDGKKEARDSYERQSWGWRESSSQASSIKANGYSMTHSPPD